MHFSSRFLAVMALACAASSPHANLLTGQTTGVTGPIAASARESAAGAKLYFDAINAKGGIHGEKIEPVVLDDKFDPTLSRANAETLIQEKNVLALFFVELSIIGADGKFKR